VTWRPARFSAGRWPVTTAAVICVIATAAAFAGPHVRITGVLAAAPLAALVIWWLAVVLLANRLWDLAPEDRRPAALRHCVRIVALLVGNLILLDVLLYGVVLAARAAAAFESTGMISLALFGLAAQERLVAATVYRVLAFVAALAATLATVRLAAAVARRFGLATVAARIGVGGVVVLIVAEIWYALAIQIAGLLPVPTVEHHTTIAEVRTVRLPLGIATVTTVGLRPWTTASGTVRVVVHRRDELASARPTPGQPVVVSARSLGFVHVVHHVGFDSAVGVPALVAAIPSAEWPRKWRIAALAREGRWPELVGQLREYRRYYPRDEEIVGRVLYSLRAGQQTALARAVEAEFRR
jgi:hypothetical protein